MKSKFSIIASILAFTFGASPKAISQWSQTNLSLPPTSAVSSFAVDDSNIFCGTYQAPSYPDTQRVFFAGDGVFASKDGINWKQASIPGMEFPNIETLMAFNGNLFASATTKASNAGSTLGFFLSTDNGTSWATQCQEDILGQASLRNTPYVFCGASLFGPGDFGLQVASDAGVERSTDSGKSWELVGSPSLLAVGSDEYLTILGSNIVCGYNVPQSGYGINYYPVHILFSSDNGVNWSDVNSGLNLYEGITCTSVNALVAIGNNLFAGTDSGVYLSSNYGFWSRVSNGLTDLNVYSFAVSGTNIFAGTATGIFLSTNNGNSWTSINSGFLPYPLPLAIFDNYIYALQDSSGYGVGVWRRPLSDFGISSVTQTPPSPPQMQSYPNPFSQSTTVTFSSQSAGFAEVTVVNLLGAQVAQLFSGELSAGEHSFAWDASGMSPGMYECIVRMNGQVQRVGMMLSN